ncbi:SRPBCC family protein [Amycolatopsis panacis]|uniref:Activator of Hsp90 ATPase homologue 1/2-like C-terminal domain-containing protein n=1 Tax=Amycolatopsis panacis TaxID=2340917 RepID=A0A419I1U4_9PSEU|nr:SRPBCC family protein [Amycolatopsis panacis]RJQ83746.1 hypothetical protein D5S19_18970 [Amycolatopsis panacis]
MSPELQTTGSGRPRVRLTRRLPHPPEKVWHAVTSPDELAHWFPAAVTVPEPPAAGARLVFTFTETGDSSEGEILVYDPPSVFEFAWNSDVVRIEVTPAGEGSHLEFTHTLNRGESAIARLAAGRHATGWDVCLDALDAWLAGHPFTPPGQWHARMAAAVERFGLAEGEILDDGRKIRFRRDLVWPPLTDAWQHLPAVPVAAEVLESREPEVLAHTWIHQGEPAGQVRWELTRDPLDGVRVELTQTVPNELAGLLPDLLTARHEQLDALFARSFGEEAEPWSASRVAAVRHRYAARGLHGRRREGALHGL